MFKKILLSFLIGLILSNQTYAENTRQSKKILIYSKDIWLSKDLFFDGEKIRIYSKFQNENNFDIKQKIQFVDNDKIIGEKNIEIAKNSSIITWIDTNLTYGEHNIIAKPVETFKSKINGEEKINTKLIANLKKIKVDKDTDGDRIGDEKDTDDDNDGISDVEEIKAGSDPKSKLSTPETEKVKKTASEVGKKTKNVISNLLEKLSEKREILKKNIDSKLEENQKENNSYLKKNEKEIIKKYSEEKTFEKEKNIFLKVLNKEKNISKIEKIVQEKKKSIEENQQLQKDKKEFLKACLYQAKYEQIKKIENKNNSQKSWWEKIWYFILVFLSFIFKNNFLTILFFIIIIWILWKIIKKF